MKLKMLSAIVVAASLATGTAAFSQQTDSTGNTSRTDPGVLENQEIMGPFFTDDTMTTLRTEDEIRQAYLALAPADQEEMKERCIDMHSTRESADESPTLRDLCGIVQAF
jgi:hypothetical protein